MWVNISAQAVLSTRLPINFGEAWSEIQIDRTNLFKSYREVILLKSQTQTYRTALAPWAVIRWHSPTQRIIVGRFRSRSDADGHLAVLRRLMPDANLQIVFDMNNDCV
ncbi:MAG: hypothetical protein SAK29_03855 [Scytonema sp. PMC 1069.18]|nr:hypothetical protein [Scytonema sp. PMC 1069.18]MEC4880889.1 hypothetical protein [Scytonema sp. PMC 1070.18]